MTGVICLRNLCAFSDANSFSNLSMEETYREAFGFTIKEIEDQPDIQKLIDYFLSKRPIPPAVQKMDKEERRKHFISKMFEIYNGFCFTPESLKENVSLISPISLVNHMNHLMKNKNANPYAFRQYWSGTGQTTILKSLAINNVDPTESYEVLLNAKRENLNLEVLEKAHSIKEKFIPLNLLLYNTGYFSMKKILPNYTAELDWTNQETKDAFFEHYIDGLGFQINDLLDALKKKSTTALDMKIFTKKLNDYFSRMLNKHYHDNEKIDHEQNHTFNLFLELLEHMPRNPLNKSQAMNTVIYHQYRLTEECKDLRLAKFPDLLFVFSNYDEKIKKAVFVEFW